MKTYPNQKVVKINKTTTNGQKVYVSLDLAAMQEAMQTLDAGAFKVYMYLAKNMDQYIFALSSADAAENYGIKKKQYDTGIKKLIEAGYLVQVDEDSNHFSFFDSPALYQNGTREEEIEEAPCIQRTQGVVSKGDKELYPKDTRNNLNNLLNNIYEPSAAAEVSNPKEENFEDYPQIFDGLVFCEWKDSYWSDQDTVKLIKSYSAENAAAIAKAEELSLIS